MFGFIADTLTSIFSILLPIFFSYKALRTSDPGVLAPWLMYWTTLSIFLLVENQFYFILYWIPFYSWIRLAVHLYLVAPGQQGCVLIYRGHIHPFLAEHERQIDAFIANSHSKARSAGLDVVKRVIEYVRVQILGQEPRRPTPPQSRNVSYTTQLFNRFAMPSAREGLAAAGGASDLFGLINKALQQTTYPDSNTSEAQARDVTASGSFIPLNLAGEERSDFVNSKREQLRTLLQAFDAEAGSSAAYPSSAQPRSATPRDPSIRKPCLSPQERDSSSMHHSRSESEFEDLGYEAMPDPEHFLPRGPPREDERTPLPSASKEGAGWGNWVGDKIWGNYGEQDSAIDHKKDS